MDPEMHVLEAHAAEQGAQIPCATEDERRAETRRDKLHPDVLLHHVGQCCIESLMLQSAPEPKCDAPAWHQHAADLTKRHALIWEELQALIAAHQIEAGIVE